MKVEIEIRKNTYYDSVMLMLITKEIKNIQGVKEVLVGMGTDLNKELATNLNLINDEIKQLNANDFFICALCEEGKFSELIERVDILLNQQNRSSDDEYHPVTLDSAIRQLPDANFVLISLPGQYAFVEARKALGKKMNVMVFSDNVSLEEEKILKEIAVEKGLLMMGPDCGTAIINHVPLAFANIVEKGNIGIVGASGTGIQEVSVIIDKLGGGISQVIGTGGRDLSKEIGGLMMIQGIKALMEDDQTKVIILVSKPPAPEVEDRILSLVKDCKKPVIVNFIGGDAEKIKSYGAIPALTLERAAYQAVVLSKGEEPKGIKDFKLSDEDKNRLIEQEIVKLKSGQKYIRGLFTGGTLCDEAMKLLSYEIVEIYSNIPLKEEYRLSKELNSYRHTCIDLGDDMFTVGRAHPMIDPSSRQERLLKEAEDEEVAVILMDFVLGNGAHEDPVGEMLPAIEKTKEIFKKRGQNVCWIASICGTKKDRQNFVEQEQKLKDRGFVVMPSNAQAARFAGNIIRRVGRKDDA